MSKVVEQARYYGESNNPLNWPSGVSRSDFVSGEVFKGKYPIRQLGIQAPAGTKFYVNNNLNPIIVGNSGIYDIDFAGVNVSIYKLNFDAASMNQIANNNSCLIVDYIYGEDEEEA